MPGSLSLREMVHSLQSVHPAISGAAADLAAYKMNSDRIVLALAVAVLSFLFLAFQISRLHSGEADAAEAG